jgi:hypothetical protein
MALVLQATVCAPLSATGAIPAARRDGYVVIGFVPRAEVSSAATAVPETAAASWMQKP